MRKKLLFIYNPHAGKGQIKNHMIDILNILTNAGYDISVHPTQCKGDATGWTVNESDGYDLIVCSGGDGTINEVATGMAQRKKLGKSEIPIGYIPAGSTNDFARSFRISSDMTKAAEQITRGRNYRCDLGQFNDSTFIYTAAFGLFTDVSYETKQEVKNVLGHAAYVIEGAKRLDYIASYPLKITCDEGQFEGDYIYGMVTNTRSIGGFSKLTGNTVDMNDGYFEVMLVKKPKSIADFNQIVHSLLNLDEIPNNESVQCFKTKEIKIESYINVSYTLDGENGGSHKEVIIKNRFKDWSLIIPSKKDVAASGYLEGHL